MCSHVQLKVFKAFLTKLTFFAIILHTVVLNNSNSLMFDKLLLAICYVILQQKEIQEA